MAEIVELNEAELKRFQPSPLLNIEENIGVPSEEASERQALLVSEMQKKDESAMQVEKPRAVDPKELAQVRANLAKSFVPNAAMQKDPWKEGRAINVQLTAEERNALLQQPILKTTPEKIEPKKSSGWERLKSWLTTK